jgi:hypothetical protein
MKEFLSKLKWVCTPVIAISYVYAVYLRWVGIKIRREHSTSEIPSGLYCYTLISGKPGSIMPRRRACPYLELNLFAPEQERGYCHLCKTGDWQYNSVGLLWDMCKECGLNDDYDEEMEKHHE